MYRRNSLGRDVLITADEVLFHAPTKHTIDVRSIESSIIVAEERFIRDELGWNLYEALIVQKNKIIADADALAIATPLVGTVKPALAVGDVVNALEYFTTPRYKDLWFKHLWKLCAECVIASAFPEGFIQFGAEGIFHNSPPAGLMVTSGQVVPLKSSAQWVLDKKIMDRISPLINSMHAYICKYKADFGDLYTRDCPNCDTTELKAVKNAGIALGTYDEESDDNCCGDGWLNR